MSEEIADLLGAEVTEAVQADPFSESSIIASLPLEAQGEFKHFGVMEEKNITELHDILLLMRETYAIPPQHPFTYLMKWYANGAASGRINVDNAWANTKYLQKEYFDPSAQCGIRNWFDATIRMQQRNGEIVEMSCLVLPESKLVWSKTAEKPIIGDSVPLYAPGNRTSKTCVCKTIVFEEAVKQLREGKVSGELVCRAMTPTEAGERGGILRNKNAVDHLSSRVIKRKHKTAEQQPVTEDQKPEIQQPVCNSASLEVLLPMFELACLKARELGMEETIKMWRTAIGLK